MGKSSKAIDKTNETREEAKTVCIDWIVRSYNRSRPHSTIRYRHPADAMAEFKDGKKTMFMRDEYDFTSSRPTRMQRNCVVR